MKQTETNFKIRKNDTIQVIAGREKGKTGKVLKVFPKAARILVEKVNMVKRHVKPSQQSTQGGITEKESPIHYSNVLLMCPKCNKGVRFGYRMELRVEAAAKKSAKGSAKNMASAPKKVRVCKKCESVLDV